jgi:hypothetical protein
MARRGAPARNGTDATPPSSYAAGDISTADWPAQAADQVERLVGVVRDNTTGKAITAARAVVLGVFAMFAAAAVIVCLVVGLDRFLIVYLPDDVFGEDHVWVAHVIVGVVLTVPGLLLLRQARRPIAPAA